MIIYRVCGIYVAIVRGINGEDGFFVKGKTRSEAISNCLWRLLDSAPELFPEGRRLY